MSDLENSPALPDFDAVDVGSWAVFTPSFEAFLGSLSEAAQAGAPARVLVTAPAPVVTEDSVGRKAGLRTLLRRSAPRVPSPEVPGMVLATRGDGIEIDLPVLDELGRVLLDDAATSVLEALGWERFEDVLVRVVAGRGEAAEAVTRALIEVLHVPHPADLDHLVAAAE